MSKMDLMDAIMARQPIEPLLAQGADVNEIRNGYSPLIVAAGNGDTTIVKTLLEWGANVNLSTENGKTPLF